MIYLLDTHLLLWVAGNPEKLPQAAVDLLENPAHEFAFSAASMWEIAIKQGLERPDFNVDANRLQRMLLLHGYREIVITSEHAIAVSALPKLHKDPFDRLLLAQSRTETMDLLTHDEALVQYGERVIKV